MPLPASKKNFLSDKFDNTNTKPQSGIKHPPSPKRRHRSEQKARTWGANKTNNNFPLFDSLIQRSSKYKHKIKFNGTKNCLQRKRHSGVEGSMGRPAPLRGSCRGPWHREGTKPSPSREPPQQDIFQITKKTNNKIGPLKGWIQLLAGSSCPNKSQTKQIHSYNTIEHKYIHMGARSHEKPTLQD